MIQTPRTDWSADFSFCKNLQIATGTYRKFVTFLGSGIHTIHKLDVQNPSKNGNFITLKECKNLKTLEGWELSKKTVIEPKKLEAEIKRRAALKKFIQETQIETLPFL
jgi:hypothetical protein